MYNIQQTSTECDYSGFSGRFMTGDKFVLEYYDLLSATDILYSSRRISVDVVFILKRILSRRGFIEETSY